MDGFDSNSWEADYAASLVAGSGVESAPVRSPLTVTSNALQSSQPVVAAAPNGWESWLRGAGTALLQYGIVRDAALSGVSRPANTTVQPGYYVQGGQAAAQPGLGPLMPLLLIGGIVYAVAKAAK